MSTVLCANASLAARPAGNQPTPAVQTGYSGHPATERLTLSMTMGWLAIISYDMVVPFFSPSGTCSRGTRRCAYSKTMKGGPLVFELVVRILLALAC